MKKILALMVAVAASSPALAAETPPKELDCFKYSKELQLAITATAISPRRPPPTIHVNRTFGTRPIMFGTTNLPDGAILSVTLDKSHALPDAEEKNIHRPICLQGWMHPHLGPGGCQERGFFGLSRFHSGPLIRLNLASTRSKSP